MPPDTSLWLRAEAPWPAGVRAGFTLRHGGVSGPPWDSLNLGDHVGDNTQAVHHNRHLLSHALEVDCRFLQQVHGTDVAYLTAQSPHGLLADACWTDAVGLAATILVADCLPVLLCSPDGRQVAAAHAGWRGLAGKQGRGVLESLADALRKNARGSDLSGWIAWLGPCIGPAAFEVGPEVRAAFVDEDATAAACFKPACDHAASNKYLADLPALARQRLESCGLSAVYGNDGSPGWCTFNNSLRFFSHRRDARRFGSTGRMAALIWRQG